MHETINIKMKTNVWGRSREYNTNPSVVQTFIKKGRTSIEDNERLGPTLSKNEENIQNVGKRFVPIVV